MRNFTVIFFFLFFQNVFAWNAAGHKLSGLIAYENLSPEVRTRIAEIVKNHPKFNDDFKVPFFVKKSGVDAENKWIFMQMAIWPDIAKGYTDTDRSEFNRTKWHYINEPVYLSSLDKEFYKDTLPTNLKRDYHNHYFKNYNIAQSYSMIVDSIKTKNVEKDVEAVFLCWIFHQIGDIHQPLHSSALFSRDKFYTGDKGGNDIYLENIGRSLHSYWDGILSESYWGESKISKQYNRIKKDNITLKMATEGQNILEMDRWIDESNRLCKAIVYTPEILKQVYEADVYGRKVNVKMTTKYFANYKHSCEAVANRRIFEAGLRLAKILEELYG